MNLFNRKKSISSNAMMHLIYDAAINKPKEIFPVFDKLGLLYDEEEATNIIFSMITELCRNELSKSNDIILVNNTIDKVYTDLFYNIKEDKEYYANKFNEVKTKIYNMNNPMQLYRLLLELININENLVEKFYVNEFTFYTNSLLVYATSLNKTYSIDKTKEEEAIDIRF